MSRIGDLGKNFDQLLRVIDEYNAELDQVEGRLSFKNKSIEEANKEQVAWLVYYDERRVEIKTLVRYFQVQIDKVRGKLHRHYTEVYSRELAERTKEKYIDHDEEYLKIQELALEVEELYEKYVAVVDAFKARGFALRNIVESRINQIHDNTL